MKEFRSLLLLFLLASTVTARGESSASTEVFAKVKAAFPACDIQGISVGTLYGKVEKDVASSLYCKGDAIEDKDGISGPYALAILRKDKNGEYRISYQTRGLLLHFGAEIKKGSLFLHSVSGSGNTDSFYDYQFRFDGRSLVLIGLEIDVQYHGSDKPPIGTEYHKSANYLTGKVIDSRVGAAPKNMRQGRKITLEEFNFEPVDF